MNNTVNTHPPLVPFATVEFGLVDAKTRDVMKSRVVPGVRVKYRTQNQKFLLWLFDNLEHYVVLMKPSLLEELATQRTKSGTPSKGRDHVRATYKEWLKRVDADKPDTHPIDLTDLTFQIYTRYLATFKKLVRKRSQGVSKDKTVAIRL